MALAVCCVPNLFYHQWDKYEKLSIEATSWSKTSVSFEPHKKQLQGLSTSCAPATPFLSTSSGLDFVLLGQPVRGLSLHWEDHQPAKQPLPGTDAMQMFFPVWLVMSDRRIEPVTILLLRGHANPQGMQPSK